MIANLNKRDIKVSKDNAHKLFVIGLIDRKDCATLSDVVILKDRICALAVRYNKLCELEVDCLGSWVKVSACDEAGVIRCYDDLFNPGQEVKEPEPVKEEVKVEEPAPEVEEPVIEEKAEEKLEEIHEIEETTQEEAVEEELVEEPTEVEAVPEEPAQKPNIKFNNKKHKH